MKNLILILIISLPYTLLAQNDEKDENIKTGWTFGAVPAISYDTDIGFKYGGVVNFFNYGDGSTYPQYLHSIYLEWSRTTKGSGINQFTYDSEYLIPGIRVSAEASLLTEKALDFFGFNGYESWYNPNFEDEDHADYISRMYYRMDRSLTRFTVDFQGDITGRQLRWFAGVAYNGIKTGTVDTDNLNKGRSENELLPDTSLLFDNYVDWGFIPESQIDGGNTSIARAGIVYDTRDNEANPMKGLWTDIQFLAAPSFLGNNELSYTRLVLNHRQYFTIIDPVLSFAYRLSYQSKLSGTMPYYMLPFVYNTAPSITRDGLGGAKTLRGIMRNRIVGEDFLYGNAEFRWKFYRTVLYKQNIYLALGTFLDGGMVTGKYGLPENLSAEANEYLANGDKESLHLSYGAGFYLVLNENFVIAINYGLTTNNNDGKSGFYMGLNFLY